MKGVKRDLSSLDWSDYDLSKESLQENFEISEKVEKVKKEEEKETCTICLDIIEKKGLVILNCGHYFHLTCFMDLQVNGDNNKRKCPNCRMEQDIPDVQNSSRINGIDINMLINSGVFNDLIQPVIRLRPLPRPVPRPVIHRHISQDILNIIQQLENPTLTEIHTRSRTLGFNYSLSRIRNVLTSYIHDRVLTRTRNGRRGYVFSLVN